MDLSDNQLVIVNKAFYKIGAKRLSALPDASPDGVLVSDIYQPCLNEILEEHPWSFAVNTVALAQLAVTLPIFNDGITIAYGLPSDFISIYMLNIRNAQYRLETLKSPVVSNNTLALLSDTPGILMKYVFFNNDPTTYTAKFSDALACRLALEMCNKVTSISKQTAEIASNYQKALISAMTADSKMSQPDRSQADEWFIARLTGAGAVTGLPDGNIGFFPDPYNPDF